MNYFYKVTKNRVTVLKTPKYPCITSSSPEVDPSWLEQVNNYLTFLEEYRITWSEGLILSGSCKYVDGPQGFHPALSVDSVTAWYGNEIPEEVSNKNTDPEWYQFNLVTAVSSAGTVGTPPVPPWFKKMYPERNPDPSEGGGVSPKTQTHSGEGRTPKTQTHSGEGRTPVKPGTIPRWVNVSGTQGQGAVPEEQSTGNPSLDRLRQRRGR